MDWYLKFAWLLIFILSILLGSYYIVNNVNSCTAQPLDYAVNQIKAKFDVIAVYGTVHLVGRNAAYDYIEFGDINFSKSESTSKTDFNFSLP